MTTLRENVIKIGAEVVRYEEKFDGVWVLKTNSDLTAIAVAHQYKQL
jgi:hypothetical protein